MNPLQHGEVFFTAGGGKTDPELGHYRCFPDVEPGRMHNVTSGDIYQTVIARERRREFLGGTVPVVPHLTAGINSRIGQVARSGAPRVAVGAAAWDCQAWWQSLPAARWGWRRPRHRARPPLAHPVADLMSDQKQPVNLGGTMRLGNCLCRPAPQVHAARAYGVAGVRERHRHGREVHSRYVEVMRRVGPVPSGIPPGRAGGDRGGVRASLVGGHPVPPGVSLPSPPPMRPLSAGSARPEGV